MHWRQGHKDECHPPSIDEGNNDGDDVSNLKGLQTNKSDLSESSVEIDTKAQPKPPGTSSARLSSESNSSSIIFSGDDINVKPDVSETESKSDSLGDTSSSSSSSSTCSTFSGFLEKSDDSSVSDDGHVLHYGKMEKALCNDFAPKEPITTVNTSKAHAKNDPLVSEGSSVNNLSCASNIEQKVHRSKVDDAKCCSSGSSGSSPVVSDNHTKARPPKDTGESKLDHVQTVFASSCRVASHQLAAETRAANEDSSCRISPSENTAQFNHRNSTALGTDNSSYVTSGRSTDVWLLKTKSSTPLPSFSSVDHESSNGGNRSLSHNMSAKDDSAPAPCRKPIETAGSVPNGTIDVKTSVRKVVQHLKSSHFSKYSPGPRSDISRKYKVYFNIYLSFFSFCFLFLFKLEGTLMLLMDLYYFINIASFRCCFRCFFRMSSSSNFTMRKWKCTPVVLPTVATGNSLLRDF